MGAIIICSEGMIGVRVLRCTWLAPEDPQDTPPRTFVLTYLRQPHETQHRKRNRLSSTSLQNHKLVCFLGSDRFTKTRKLHGSYYFSVPGVEPLGISLCRMINSIRSTSNTGAAKLDGTTVLKAIGRRFASFRINVARELFSSQTHTKSLIKNTT
jgi:hypothetical protein